MWKVMMVVLLSVPASAQAAEDFCRPLIPAGLEQEVEQTYPGFRMPRSTDNLDEDVAYNRSQKGTGCLGVARGDFDGDGADDSLLALADVDGQHGAVVVALAGGKRWKLRRLELWGDDRKRLFVDIGKPGIYRRTEALLGPRERLDEPMRLTCRHAAAIFGETEASAVAYCLENETWRRVQISD